MADNDYSDFPKLKNLTVKSDSQLIVGQVKGEYEAKEDRMKKYLTVV